MLSVVYAECHGAPYSMESYGDFILLEKDGNDWQWQTRKLTFGSNEGISAARFCHQVAAWVPDMFCNFYLVKNNTKLLIAEQLLKLYKK
jgi:hypothetical protein